MNERVIAAAEKILERGNDVMLRKRRNREGELETVVFEIRPAICDRVPENREKNSEK